MNLISLTLLWSTLAFLSDFGAMFLWTVQLWCPQNLGVILQQEHSLLWVRIGLRPKPSCFDVHVFQPFRNPLLHFQKHGRYFRTHGHGFKDMNYHGFFGRFICIPLKLPRTSHVLAKTPCWTCSSALCVWLKFRVASNKNAKVGTMWGPPSIAKLVNIIPITMVYDTDKYSIHGDTPIYN